MRRKRIQLRIQGQHGIVLSLYAVRQYNNAIVLLSKLKNILRKSECLLMSRNGQELNSEKGCVLSKIVMNVRPEPNFAVTLGLWQVSSLITRCHTNKHQVAGWHLSNKAVKESISFPGWAQVSSRITIKECKKGGQKGQGQYERFLPFGTTQCHLIRSFLNDPLFHCLPSSFYTL